MSRYLEIKVTCPKKFREIIIAQLDLMGYEGFLEQSRSFRAYIREEDFDAVKLENLLSSCSTPGKANTWTKKIIRDKNWNEAWEQSYSPVVIDGKYQIRAPFHPEDKNCLQSVIISPKLAFGTGHHDTTANMIRLMEKTDFRKKKVLDFGAGTGILSVFAELFGASSVTAVDNDPVTIACALENILYNNCHIISVSEGDLSVVPRQKFDIILANINRNVLTASMKEMDELTANDASLLLSGFYLDDLDIVKKEAQKFNFHLNLYLENNNWTACLFKKTFA